MLHKKTFIVVTVLFVCMNSWAQAELSLRQHDDELYHPLDSAAVSKQAAGSDSNGYKNTPRQMNVDLSDQFRYEQNGVYTSGGTDGVSIRAKEGPTEYFIMVDREKSLGFPKRVFLKMNLDEQEPAAMTFDYGSIQKIVLFPDMIGGKMRMFGTDVSGKPMLSIYIGKDYLHESWIEEYRAAFKAKFEQLCSYESEKSFSEKYIIPKKE